MQWNDKIRARFQKLIQVIADRFDGKVDAIILPETAIDIDMKIAKKKFNFTCDKYFNAELENINFARQVFKKSHVIQFINFWPCEWDNDHKYMSRFFENAIKNNIGLGGPDIIPYKQGQMKNSYPFFNKFKGKIKIVAMSIQGTTRTYINKKSKKKFTDQEFTDFAVNYLGSNYILRELDF